MATQEITKLKVNSRKSSKGTDANRAIPAVVYGPKLKSTPIFIEQLVAEKFGAARFESTLFDLESDSSELTGTKVLFKEVQRHPVTRKPIHVDFYAPDMSKSVRVRVKINLVGVPRGVKESGGQLTQVIREVEVECNPLNIPDQYELDVSNVDLNESLHVADLNLGEGVKAITNSDRTIATVTPPKEEEAATPEAAAPAAAEGAAAAPAAAPAAE